MKTIKELARELLRQFPLQYMAPVKLHEFCNELETVLKTLAYAPEPDPVAHAVILPNGMTRIWFSDKERGEQWRKEEGIKQELTPLYTAPPANNQSEQNLEMVNPPAPSVPDGWLEILEAVLREMPARKGVNGNAPGHGHRITGIWDDDNGPLSGKPCAWCMTWNKVKSMLAEQQPEQPADLVRDAERGQKMMELLDIGAVDGARIATEQVDMAIEHDKKGGA